MCPSMQENIFLCLPTLALTDSLGNVAVRFVAASVVRAGRVGREVMVVPEAQARQAQSIAEVQTQGNRGQLALAVRKALAAPTGQTQL